MIIKKGLLILFCFLLSFDSTAQKDNSFTYRAKIELAQIWNFERRTTIIGIEAEHMNKWAIQLDVGTNLNIVFSENYKNQKVYRFHLEGRKYWPWKDAQASYAGLAHDQIWESYELESGRYFTEDGQGRRYDFAKVIRTHQGFLLTTGVRYKSNSKFAGEAGLGIGIRRITYDYIGQNEIILDPDIEPDTFLGFTREKEGTQYRPHFILSAKLTMELSDLKGSN